MWVLVRTALTICWKIWLQDNAENNVIENYHQYLTPWPNLAKRMKCQFPMIVSMPLYNVALKRSRNYCLPREIMKVGGTLWNQNFEASVTSHHRQRDRAIFFPEAVCFCDMRVGSSEFEMALTVRIHRWTEDVFSHVWENTLFSKDSDSETEDIIAIATSHLKRLSKKSFQDCFYQLHEFWQKRCVTAEDDYFEGNIK